MPNKDLYAILGINRDISQDDIKAAYKRLAMKYHPDRNSDEDTAEIFKDINSAYEILSDEIKRAEYDLTGDISKPNELGAIINEAINLFANTVSSCPDNDNVDIIQLMTKRVNSVIIELGQANAHNLSVIKKFNKIKKRIHKKKGKVGPNLFVKTLEERISQCQVLIEINNERIRYQAKLLEYILTYCNDIGNISSELNLIGNIATLNNSAT